MRYNLSKALQVSLFECYLWQTIILLKNRIFDIQFFFQVKSLLNNCLSYYSIFWYTDRIVRKITMKIITVLIFSHRILSRYKMKQISNNKLNEIVLFNVHPFFIFLDTKFLLLIVLRLTGGWPCFLFWACQRKRWCECVWMFDDSFKHSWGGRKCCGRNCSGMNKLCRGLKARSSQQIVICAGCSLLRFELLCLLSLTWDQLFFSCQLSWVPSLVQEIGYPRKISTLQDTCILLSQEQC